MPAINDDGCALTIVIALVLTVLSAAPARPAAQGGPPRVGQAVRVDQRSLQITDSDQEPLVDGSSIYQQSTINTNRVGRAEIELDDGTSLTLGANSDLVIDDFVYQPERDTGRASVRLLQGMMRVLSGRMQPGSFSISTRVAVLGVRGTAFTIDNTQPDMLTIHVDEGVVLARPLQSSKAFELSAPAYAVCTLTTCTLGDRRRAWTAPLLPFQSTIASSERLTR